MTIEEFDSLPKTEPFYYELRNGELVKVSRPIFKNHRIRHQLRVLLESAAGSASFVATGLGFRALPEYEYRVAHVGMVSKERWEQIDLDDSLFGAPDLVAEVIAPSELLEHLYDKEKLCLANGCQEFWTVYPELRQVKVSTPDGITTTFRAGQEIPLRLFGGGTLKVDSIFS